MCNSNNNNKSSNPNSNNDSSNPKTNGVTAKVLLFDGFELTPFVR